MRKKPTTPMGRIEDGMIVGDPVRRVRVFAPPWWRIDRWLWWVWPWSRPGTKRMLRMRVRAGHVDQMEYRLRVVRLDAQE